MGSFTDYRARAAKLRQQANSAHGEKIRAELTYLAERFEKLALSPPSVKERQTDTRSHQP